MTHSRPHHKHLIYTVLPDEAAAFAAYRVLQCYGISPENLAIVGKGYTTLENIGLSDPYSMAWRFAWRCLWLWLKIGSVVGILIYVMFQPKFPAWATYAMYSNFVLTISCTALLSGGVAALCGGAYGFWRGNTTLIWREYLQRGKYLLLLEGSESLVTRGREILRSYQEPLV